MKFLVLWLSFVSEITKVIYLTWDLGFRLYITLHFGAKAVEKKKSLMKAERNYSVIEEEALAIIFSIRKFQQYLYGQTISHSNCSLAPREGYHP